MGEAREAIASDHHFLFKPLADVRNGGCRVEVWLPKGLPKSSGPIPLAMLSHGGGWSMGASDMVPYNQIRYLHNNGIAAASFEYRHLPHVTMKDIREDLVDGYRYVQTTLNKDLQEAGSSVIVDPSRCSYLGWSAGGTNVLYMGHDIAKHGLPPLKAIVATYPLTKFDNFGLPTSLGQLHDSSTPSGAVRGQLLSMQCNTTFKVGISDIGDLVEKLTSSTTGTPDLTQFNPRLVYSLLVIQSGMANLLFDQDGPFPGDASPINLITSSFPPTCIISATNDTLIPVDHSKDAAAKLQQKGVDSLLVSCEGMGHGEAECYPGQPWQDRWWGDAIKPSLDFTIQRM